MASFDTFSNGGGDIMRTATRPFDEDGYIGYDPRLASQRYDPSSFSSFSPVNSDAEADLPPVVAPSSMDEAIFVDHATPVNGVPPYPIEIYGFESSSPTTDYPPSPIESSLPARLSGHLNHYDVGAHSGGIFSSDGPILPEPRQMLDEGFAFREWRRQNAVHLEQKEIGEKEMRNKIMEEADEYKQSFYEKRKLGREAIKSANREREKLYLSNEEKLHKEAEKQCWKSIAEMIPREVPGIASRRAKREIEKKPSVAVVHGPKPGKPADMSRMRHLLLKLKQHPPPHMAPRPATKDAKVGEEGKFLKDSAGNTPAGNVTGMPLVPAASS